MSDPAKIGFSPDDRFMMTLGSTLVVVRNDGSVFGSDVVNGQAQAVFEFGGAKIGFNPQDRFMMTLGNTLVVVTQDGSVYGSDVVNRQLQPVFQFGGYFPLPIWSSPLHRSRTGRNFMLGGTPSDTEHAWSPATCG